MSALEKPAEERLRFVKHKGHAIYLIDVSHCAAKELLVLLELIRADIARHAPGSVLTLVGRSRNPSARVLRALQNLFAAGAAQLSHARRRHGLAGNGRIETVAASRCIVSSRSQHVGPAR
jgi:hypothetical protein